MSYIYTIKGKIKESFILYIYTNLSILYISPILVSLYLPLFTFF